MTACKPHGGAPLLSPPSLSWSGYLVRQGVQSGTPLPLQQSPPAAERQMCRIEQNRIIGIIAFKIQKSQTDGLNFLPLHVNRSKNTVHNTDKLECSITDTTKIMYSPCTGREEWQLSRKGKLTSGRSESEALWGMPMLMGQNTDSWRRGGSKHILSSVFRLVSVCASFMITVHVV